MVGVVNSPPRAAVTIEIGNAREQIRSVALEEGVRLDREENVEIARRAAAQAGLAFAGGRIRVPSSTPAGMFTVSVRSRVTRPDPPQESQGSSITSPRPWQLGQVRSMVKKPCWARTRPIPPQVGQPRGFEPGLAPVPLQASTSDRGGNG